MKGFWVLFLLHFFLWKMGFVFKGTSSWETAEYPILLLIQVLKMSPLQLLAFLPSLFLSHSEMLLLLPTLYSYPGSPFVSKNLPTIKSRLLLSSLPPSLHSETTSLCLSSFWLQHLKGQDLTWGQPGLTREPDSADLHFILPLKFYPGNGCIIPLFASRKSVTIASPCPQLSRLSWCKVGTSWRWWWWWWDLVMAKCTRSNGANRKPGNKKCQPGITALPKHGSVAAWTRVPANPEASPTPTHFSPASAPLSSHLNPNAVSMATHSCPGRPSPDLSKY